MNLELLESFGKIAGIAGIAVGTLLIIYRQIIAKNIFPNLTKKQSYNIILFVIITTWTIALVGIGAWVYVESNSEGITKTENNIKKELLAVKSLNEINYSLYRELKDNRIDTVYDTYQNLQLIKVSNNPKKSMYESNIKSLLENNDKISNYLIELQDEFKSSEFKKVAEIFIKHSGLVKTKYLSAMSADSISELPKIVIKYPENFEDILNKEIELWK